MEIKRINKVIDNLGSTGMGSSLDSFKKYLNKFNAFMRLEEPKRQESQENLDMLKMKVMGEVGTSFLKNSNQRLRGLGHSIEELGFSTYQQAKTLVLDNLDPSGIISELKDHLVKTRIGIEHGVASLAEFIENNPLKRVPPVDDTTIKGFFKNLGYVPQEKEVA